MSVMSITITRLRRAVHRAVVREHLVETVRAGIAREMRRESLMYATQAPDDAQLFGGWPCLRCGCIVPEGEDRTRHYVPGH